MKVRTLTTGVCAVLVLALSLVLAPGADAQPRRSSRSASSPVAPAASGTRWAARSAASSASTSRTPRRRAEATTAAIDNMKLLTAGKAGLSFAYDYHVGWANDGKVPGLSGKHKIRMVMGFYEQPLHIVTKEGTGITTVTPAQGQARLRRRSE